jgi:hypothetical protein
MKALLMMMMTSCMTGLQPLKNLQQSPDEIKGYQGLLEILKAQLGTTDKAHQILKEVQLYFLKTGAMTLPLQAI